MNHFNSVVDLTERSKKVSGQLQRQMSYSIDPRKNAPLGDELKIGGLLNGKLYIDLVEGI